MSLFPPTAYIQSLLGQGNEVLKLEWILAHPGQGMAPLLVLPKSRSRVKKSQVSVLRAETAQYKNYLNDSCESSS